MLRIHYIHSKTGKPDKQVNADRIAIRYGLTAAILITLFNLLVVAFGNGGFETAHLAIFIILFLAIGYGMNQARAWIRDTHALEDRMAFGMVMSMVTGIGIIVLNSILVLLNYHLVVSESVLPITDGFKFAVNSMALFLGCIIFGFLSTFIFSYFYEKE